MSRTTRKKNLLVGLAAAGVLAVGVAAPTVAMAADNETPPTAGADADREQRHAERQDAFAEALAGELGVDTAKVTAALEKIREQHRADRPERPDAADRQAALKERLDQAVADGTLTREQADAITAAAEAGVLGGGARPHR
ncbi:hypothetical protein [Micromonospora endolithica]|uniref:Uncharacterized protein n=1 Tax=Micromonospora endolithica TaxID=230091 RepID=A0A3A9ZSI3_9ACTN|nr:hypothetical protein [Micromonospora endolithica]RKN50924.1 hypothetical protein D7223_04035 [Micromonospora endolithica]TWJ20302.1 hypothetical protein JD76_00400 [Micromonospora endolithica]